MFNKLSITVIGKGFHRYLICIGKSITKDKTAFSSLPCFNWTIIIMSDWVSITWLTSVAHFPVEILFRKLSNSLLFVTVCDYSSLFAIFAILCGDLWLEKTKNLLTFPRNQSFSIIDQPYVLANYKRTSFARENHNSFVHLIFFVSLFVLPV